jgi:hypothetical protein
VPGVAFSLAGEVEQGTLFFLRRFDCAAGLAWVAAVDVDPVLAGAG